jgi:hypothetical protein
MDGRFQFSLRRAFLAITWAAVWGLAYAVDQMLRTPYANPDPSPIFEFAMWPPLGILPFTAIGALLGDTLVGTVVGGIFFSIAVVVVQSSL